MTEKHPVFAIKATNHFAVWTFEERRNMQISWTRLVDFSVFFVNYYNSLIYVKRVVWLISWVFPFVGPRGSISWSKIAKIFLHVRIEVTLLYIFLLFWTFQYQLGIIFDLFCMLYPLDTERTLYVHKAFKIRPGRLLNLLCMFNFCLVSKG